MGHSSKPPVAAGGGSPLLWRAPVAAITDAVTVLFSFWALSVLQVLWFMDSLTDRFAPDPWQERFAATLVFSLLWAMYEVLFLCRNRGRTPGRERFGVAITGRGRFVRALLAAPIWMIPPLWLATVCAVASNVPVTGGRSLLDVLARTKTTSFDRPLRRPSERNAVCGDVREEAAPPTAMTILLGRRNARRFAPRPPKPPSDPANTNAATNTRAAATEARLRPARSDEPVDGG